MNLRTKFINVFRKNVETSKKLSVGLLSFMIMLSLLAPVVNANDFQPNSDTTNEAEEKADAAAKPNDETSETVFDAIIADGLEIGSEIIGQVLRASAVQPPIVNTVSPGDKVISGKGLVGSGQRRRFGVDPIIHVTVEPADGREKEIKKYDSKGILGSNWKVELDNPLVAGDKIYVKQEFNGGFSDEVFREVKKTLASLYDGKLTMPELEVWSEDLNTIDEEAAKEISIAFIKENNKLANVYDNNFEGNLLVPSGAPNEKKPIVVSGDGKSITVNFDDTSSLRLKFADKITVKQITETSNPAIIEKLKIVDGKISGRISGNGPFTKATVKIVKFLETIPDTFCTEKGCKINKNAIVLATLPVNENTGEFSYTLNDQNLQLGKNIGVIVKEYRKKNNCTLIKPEVVLPAVTPVRDPKKLTDEEKNAIIAAIRKANTTEDGRSRLPDGTGDTAGIPALVEFDKDGNVRIISPNNVEVERWDNRKPIFKTNPDGTYKVKADKENDVYKMAEKDLISNLKPDKPNVKADEEKIVITPNPKDTDANTITVEYTDANGEAKKELLKKSNDGKWSTSPGSNLSVDSDTGVVTIAIDKLKNKTSIVANVTDEGGIADNDKDPKTSESVDFELRIPPKTPKIEVNDADGSVTITPVGKDQDRIAKKMDITYTPAGKDAPVTVTAERDDDGKWKLPGGSDFVVSKDGKSITIANDKLASETSIKAQTNDGDDNDLLTSKEVKVDKITDKTAPKPPLVKLNEKTGDITITPPKDKDTTTVEVKYNDPNGVAKTVIANKADNGKWTLQDGSDVSIDEDTGVITIKYAKLKKADTVSAIAKDKVGNDSPQRIETTLPPAPKVDSDAETGIVTVTPPTDAAVDGMEITYIPGGSDESKTLKVSKDNAGTWTIEDAPKDVTIDANGKVTFAKGTAKEESKVRALSKIGSLKGLETSEDIVPDKTAPETPDAVVEKDGSVSVTPKGGDEISVEVTYTPAGKDQTTTIIASKENGTWKLPDDVVDAKVDKDSGKITFEKGKVQSGTDVTAIAKDKANNVSDKGTASPVEVKFNVNGAKKNIDSSILAKGGNFVLPEIFEKENFPEDKKFAGWKVGDDETLKNPKDTITINSNTEITAIWKDIEYKVSFNANSGSGNMEVQFVKKGKIFKLPENKFTAPSDKQEFKNWQIDGKDYAPGAEITVDKDTEVKAIWKNKETTNPGTPGGQNPGKPGDQTPGKPGDQNPGNPGDQTPGKPGDQTPGKPGENPGDNPNQPGTDKPGLTPGQNVPHDKDLVPGQSGSNGKDGKQTNGTSNLNSKNNGGPNTGDNGLNMLYAFGLAFAACGVLVMNRISRKEK